MLHVDGPLNGLVCWPSTLREKYIKSKKYSQDIHFNEKSIQALQPQSPQWWLLPKVHLDVHIINSTSTGGRFLGMSKQLHLSTIAPGRSQFIIHIDLSQRFFFAHLFLFRLHLPFFCTHGYLWWPRLGTIQHWPSLFGCALVQKHAPSPTVLDSAVYKAKRHACPTSVHSLILPMVMCRILIQQVTISSVHRKDWCWIKKSTHIHILYINILYIYSSLVYTVCLEKTSVPSENSTLRVMARTPGVSVVHSRV